MNTRASSRVPLVDIYDACTERQSSNVAWRGTCVHVMSPNRFETTSRGGFSETNPIEIDSAVQIRFNWLGADPWCSEDKTYE